MLWLRNGITNLDRGSRPGSKALDVAARLDVRTDLDRGSRPGSRRSTCGLTWTAAPGPVVRGHNAHAVRWSVPSPWSLASWWRHLGVRVGVKGERHMVRVGMWDAGCSHVAKQLKT